MPLSMWAYTKVYSRLSHRDFVQFAPARSVRLESVVAECDSVLAYVSAYCLAAFRAHKDLVSFCEIVLCRALWPSGHHSCAGIARCSGFHFEEQACPHLK